MHIRGYDYIGDRPTDTVGLSRTAALIRAARSESPNTLLFDNGDSLQGTLLDEVATAGIGREPHPMVQALQAIKVDAASIGNHDFDYGLDVLRSVIDQADFPFVCANVVTRRGEDIADDVTFAPPYAILDRHMVMDDGSQAPIRIGVIGLLPPQLMTWYKSQLRGRLDVRGITEAAQVYCRKMRAEGADLIVALAHTGISDLDHGPMSENAALQLAELGICDALITGHVHQVFPGDAFAHLSGVNADAGTLHGTPSVMAGAWGSHLGVIDLDLVLESEGWRVASHRAEARAIVRRQSSGRAVPLVQEDQTILSAVEDHHKRAVERSRRIVGHTDQALHTYFAMIGPSAALDFVNAAQSWHVRRALAETSLRHLPVLSAVAPFRAGGRGGPENYTFVPAGAMTWSHLASLYHFTNQLRAILVTGRTLRDWLERSASVFDTVADGARDHALLGAESQPYNFDVVAGVSYDIDLSAPARFDRLGNVISDTAQRVANLSLDGAPVQDTDEFILATSSFRLDGGGHFPTIPEDKRILSDTTQIRGVLETYAASHSGPPAAGAWRLHIPKGATVLFDTAPDADRHLTGVHGFQFEDLGVMSNGFRRLRLEPSES